MDEEADKKQPPPARDYTVAQMVAAVRKGAPRQIERMKYLLAELHARQAYATGNHQEEEQPQQSGGSSQQENKSQKT